MIDDELDTTPNPNTYRSVDFEDPPGRDPEADELHLENPRGDRRVVCKACGIEFQVWGHGRPIYCGQSKCRAERQRRIQEAYRLRKASANGGEGGVAADLGNSTERA